MSSFTETMGNYLPPTKTRAVFLELRPILETVHEQLSAFNYKLVRNVLLPDDMAVILRSLHQCHGQFASLLSNTSVQLNRREREGLRHNKQMMGMLIDLMEGRGSLSTPNMSAFPSMFMSSGGRPLYESVDDTAGDDEAQHPWITTPGSTLNYHTSSNRQVTFADDVVDKLSDLPTVPLSHNEHGEDEAKETDGLLASDAEETPTNKVVLSNVSESESETPEQDKGWVKVTDEDKPHEEHKPKESQSQEPVQKNEQEMVVHTSQPVSVPAATHITYTSTVATLGSGSNQSQDLLQQVVVVLEGVRTALRWADVKLEQHFMLAQTVGYTRSVLLLIAFIACAICVAWPAIGMLVLAFILVALTVLVDVADQLFLAKGDPDRMLRDNGPKKIRPCQMV